MRYRGSAATLRPSGRVASMMVAAVVHVVLAGCGSTNRPATEPWIDRWEQKQALVPTVDEMVAGGRPYCDRLVADLRAELDDLEPAPSESIDPTLEAWGESLRTLAFECPTDPARIRAELAVVEDLQAEIRAALDEP